MSGPRPPSVLRAVVPTPGRVAGAVVAGAAAAGLGWFVGVEPARAALLALAAGVLVLLGRLQPEPGGWPEAPGRPTRPGWHGVAATQRQLEAARTDAADRALVAGRLERLVPDGRTDAVRAAVGLDRGRRRAVAPPSPPADPAAPPPEPPTSRRAR